MGRNPRIVLLTGDLGFGVLKPVWEQFPERIFNAGIAEQGMVSLAAGLAATGRIVIVYSIGNFPTLRPLEQIRNDCAYPGANVKIVCIGGGFVYGSLGMSHHATEDLAVLRAIPGVTCFAPGDPAETEAVTRAMLETPGTCYLRLGRGNEPKVHTEPVQGWKLPEAITLKQGKDIALLSTGGILTQTAKAAEILEQRHKPLYVVILARYVMAAAEVHPLHRRQQIAEPLLEARKHLAQLLHPLFAQAVEVESVDKGES